MREINCNVIRDLLPSYMDEICSEDSRLLVEEHLAGCKQCRAKLEMIKSTELIDGQGEEKRISYLKKIKRHYANKGIISFIFLTLIMIGGFWFMAHHSELIGGSFFYILFPLLITAAYCMMPGNSLSAKPSKFSGLLIIVSILLMVYFFVMVYWGIQINSTLSGPFGIPLDETGYFMQRRLIFIIIMQLVIFIVSNILTFCAYRINQFIYGLSLTGMYLAVGYICLLHNMSTLEGFYRLLLKMNGYIILEGIVFSIAARIFAKKM